MLADTAGHKLTVLLCDSAQAAGGKLYVLGGGWSRVLALTHQIPMALAVQAIVPWTDANEPLALRVRLLTADNSLVELEGRQIEVTGRFEVGRPPGLPRGTPLDTTFALPFSLPLPAGIYVWEVSLGERVTETVRFEVVRPTQQTLPLA